MSTVHRGSWGPAFAVLLSVAGCASSPPRTRLASVGDDSVSIGYGRVPRWRSTAAVGSVEEATIAAQHVGRVEELFQGRLAGVEVRRTASGDYSIRVRNATTLLPGGSSEPLIVVDGVPAQSGFGSVLSALSPGDVSRIEVLKDAAATSAYGIRGGNGVILITMKRSRAP